MLPPVFVMQPGVEHISVQRIISISFFNENNFVFDIIQEDIG